MAQIRMMIQQLDPYLPWVFGASIAMFFGTLIVVPLLIVRMPADYFVVRRPAEHSWRRQHPLLRYGTRIFKNLLGIVFLGSGVIMLFTPGQGVLMILFGLVLLDIPGKRNLEMRIIRRPAILQTINRIRQRAGRRPLDVPPRKDQET